MRQDIKLTSDWVQEECNYQKQMAQESHPLSQGHLLRVALCEAWLNTETVISAPKDIYDNLVRDAMLWRTRKTPPPQDTNMNNITVVCNKEHEITPGVCALCERDALAAQNRELLERLARIRDSEHSITELAAMLETVAEFIQPRSATVSLSPGSDAAHLHKKIRVLLGKQS